MSTHSKVGILDGEVLSAIYIHFDGGLNWVGKCLLEHIRTASDVHSLVKEGPLNSLMHDKTGALAPDKITGCDPTEFGLHLKGVYVGNVSIHHENIRNLMEEEFSYLFHNGRWYYNRNGNEWIVLTKEMIEIYG